MKTKLVRVALTGLTASLLAATALAAVPASAASSDYNTGYSLGQKAYEYGLPLLDMNRLFANATSIDVPDTSGNGPVNQFSNAPHLVKIAPDEQKIVAPNHDTLYSLAWLDLSQEP